MGMTRDRRRWERMIKRMMEKDIERNGKGWKTLEETGTNEKGGKPLLQCLTVPRSKMGRHGIIYVVKLHLLEPN